MLASLVAVLLLSVRFGVAVGMAPPFTAYGMPSFVRLLLVFALAASVAASAGPHPDGLADLVDQPHRLLLGIGAEAVVGMLLGLGTHVLLAAFAFAGRLLDIQIGFGIGSVFDPVTRASANVMASLTSILGVTLFFVTEAHLALISLVSRSVQAFPLGTLPSFEDPMRLLSACGVMFSIGLALAAPVVLALLMTDVLVGVASRNLPQVNVLVLSIPLKVLVGYFVLAISVMAWAPIADSIFGMAGTVLGERR
jgi:flagellar biosynthesis protein FliR